MSRTPLRIGAVVVAAAATTLSLTPLVQAAPAAAPAASPSCDTRVNNTHAKLAECVTLEGVRAHQAALQAIADANAGTRVSGTDGYNQSKDYVVEQLEAAGYTPEVQAFTFNTFIVKTPTVLEQVSPAPAGPIPTNIMSYSGSGDVTASVSTVNAITGCNAADFAGFPAGDIALISRGTCSFAIKATNAFNAGASAVVIYNNAPGTLNGTLSDTFTLDIPVTSVTQDIGTALAATPGLVLRVKTDTLRGPAETFNIFAERKGTNAGNVVMAGAHLDSVNAGPGINDNGSGSAAILEVAEQMSKVNPVNTVRFAWWGAEESGLVGSTRYVQELSQEEQDKIALYLNFDMVGSPNHVFFVYDGDDSDLVGNGAGPAGSDRIEKTFEAFYSQRGIPFKGTDFSGRSDYGPFIAVGIPSGGLFTGAEGVKTPDEAALWGGTAGQPYDPCYHLACDTYDNNNDEALDVNSDAIAFSVLQYAMNTSDINGIPGKDNFPPVYPTTTGLQSQGSQGGLHDDHDHEADTE